MNNNTVKLIDVTGTLVDDSAEFFESTTKTETTTENNVLDNVVDDESSSKRIKLDTSSHIIASHYNTIEDKGQIERKNSRIFYMRNFNNWIKSMLINEYIALIKDSSKLGAPLRVLDMCCGKGGDLLKWEKANITHVICTDIANISVQQCEARYRIMLERYENGRNKFSKIFTAEFISCDSTLQRLREEYRDPSIELNLVSCQFAFHYCFESLKQAECMIRNAAECLRPGGYFIGTIPDAYEIMKRQRIANTTTFGNDVYQITFLCDVEEPPLFGAKYNFQLDGVVDCPEFLVYFPLLVKLARKFGLELVMKQRFEDYYTQNLENGKSLIERMSALETFPPLPGNEDGCKTDEYEHAIKYFSTKFKDTTSGHNAEAFKRCGTLSKSEWEAATLYLVFAFKKMKTEWNQKGEAVYV